MYLKNCYLPQPPRAWSRVQNSCSVSDYNGLVKDPYTGQLVSGVVLAEKIAMLNKGNVLQYKANSSNLTKAQKYSQIAKGQWVNRNTTWATQTTRGYTNPNTTSLKRTEKSFNIAIDPITGTIIGPTTAPPTCPQPVITNNEGLPSNGGGGSDVKDPEIPPPIQPTPGSNVFPVIIPDTPIEPIVIQDGGSLICSVQENVCTGEIKRTLAQQLCHPTTDSDVPGTIQDLCWNDGIQTWYPRQRYIMTNSGNKWPTNAILLSAITPSPPVITSITCVENIITLTWYQEELCLPVSGFDIYQNGVFIKSVSGGIFTAEFIAYCGIYSYFIIAVTNGSNISSEKSNTVSININASSPPRSIIVNWAAADFYDEIMDINLIFTPPLTSLCGNPYEFIVDVLNSNSDIIGKKSVPYISGNTSYTVNFNDVPYSKTGSVSVYLTTIEPNTGIINNGDNAVCNFISSDLPIYLNVNMNSDRSEISFNIITESVLRPVGGFIIPNLTSVPISITYFNWDTFPTLSNLLNISLQSLVNNEYQYSVKINSLLFGFTSFPYPVGFVVSNSKGIQQTVS